MNLQEFLNSNPVGGMTADVSISPRFKDADGKPLLFTIRAMAQDEYEEHRKNATRVNLDRGARNVSLDFNKYLASVVVEQTVTPNFKDAASIQALGCVTPQQYMKKVLLAGEVEELFKEILDLSGFNTNINTLIEDAKN